MKDGAPDTNAADARLDARLRAEFTPPRDAAAGARRALAAAGVPLGAPEGEATDEHARHAPRSGSRSRPRSGRLKRVAAAAVLLVGLGLAVDAWIGKRSELPTAFEDGPRPADAIDWTRAYGELTAALARTPLPVLHCDASTDLGPYLAGGVCPDPSVRFAAGRVIQGPLECNALPDASVLGIPASDGKPPVFVVVKELAPGPLPVAENLGDLKLHRRVVGKLDLYELTPLEEPSCLDLFQVQGGETPPPSCSWTQVQ